MERLKLIHNARGLTLVEVLVSITILGIIMTTFLSFFNQAYSYTKKNENKTVGINVARNVLYYFEQQDFEKIYQAYFNENDDISEKEINHENCNDALIGEKTEMVFDDPSVCKSFFSTKINNVDYESKVIFTKGIESDEVPDKNAPDLQEQLIGVEVTVMWNSQTASVRGLIQK